MGKATSNYEGGADGVTVGNSTPFNSVVTGTGASITYDEQAGIPGWAMIPKLGGAEWTWSPDELRATADHPFELSVTGGEPCRVKLWQDSDGYTHLRISRSSSDPLHTF